MKFSDAPAMRVATSHRPSPPVRRGHPPKQPGGGKAATDATERQRLFEAAVWQIAQARGAPEIPTTFEIEGFGPAYLDQGSIAMASDWMDYTISRDGWPVNVRIKPDVWAQRRPSDGG